jgi:hypothetical protein
LIGSAGVVPDFAVPVGAVVADADALAEAAAVCSGAGALVSCAGGVPVAASGSAPSVAAGGVDPRGSLTTCWPFGSQATKATAMAARAAMWANRMELS